MDDSDRESWSFVDEDDATGRVFPAPCSENSSGGSQDSNATPERSVSRSQRSAARGPLDGMSGGNGNDSPSTSVVLEAVGGTSPPQQWDLSSSFSPSKSQSTQSSARGSISRDFESTGSHAANLYAEAVDVVSPSDSGPMASSATTGSVSFPETLPPIHTAVEEEAYNYDDGDNMSEDSSGTGVIVGHPCSDEEDSAERRWRRAEQRGNDIRRARAPPCPKAVGTEGFLKVIVVGESGLGKTTFIQNLQATFQSDAPPSPPAHGETANPYDLFEQSPQDMCTEVTINNATSKFHYLLQDTPGLIYGQTSVRIPDYITAQNEAYLAWEQNPERCASMSASDDHRVDACLFFLNPNYLKDAEVAAMAHLSDLVPVVPMIAKADIFTPSELTAFRLHVQKRITEEEDRLGKTIMWRPEAAQGEEGGPEEEEDVERCSQPPFAVIASSHTDLAVGRFWPVRTYPWGRCEALSSSNSDLASLKRLLFEDGFAGLKQATEQRYYRFRRGQLTQGGAGQASPAAEDESDAEEAEPPLEPETESDSDDISEIAQPDAAAAVPAAHGEPAHVERRSRHSMWLWGLVITGIVCGCSLISNVSQLQADKKTLQKELRAAQDLADMKDQAASEMKAYKPLADEQHMKPHTIVQMKDSLGDGSGCTMLISAWRETLHPPLQHTRKHAHLATVQPPSKYKLVALQEAGDAANLTVLANSTALPVSETASEASQEPCPEPIALYIPHAVTSASHAALQSVTRAAQTARQVGTAAGAHSLAAIQYTSHHSAVKACAAATAVAAFSREVGSKACSLSQSTSLALHHGMSQTSASLRRQWAAARVAVGRAGHATALAIQSFGSDVTEASRVMVWETPAVVRRMQDDVSYVVKGAQDVVKHAGSSVAHSVSHATHQVGRTMQNMRILNLHFSMPRTGWDAKTWLRILARLGMLGAVL